MHSNITIAAVQHQQQQDMWGQLPRYSRQDSNSGSNSQPFQHSEHVKHGRVVFKHRRLQASAALKATTPTQAKSTNHKDTSARTCAHSVSKQGREQTQNKI
jgi:hypothetical protein